MQRINQNKTFVHNIRTNKSLRTAYAFLVDRPMKIWLVTPCTPCWHPIWDLKIRSPTARAKNGSHSGHTVKNAKSLKKGNGFIVFFVMTKVIDGFEIGSQNRERGPMTQNTNPAWSTENDFEEQKFDECFRIKLNFEFKKCTNVQRCRCAVRAGSCWEVEGRWDARNRISWSRRRQMW